MTSRKAYAKEYTVSPIPLSPTRLADKWRIIMADVFGFLQTFFRTEAERKKVVSIPVWTDPLEQLGKYVKLNPTDSKVTWIPHASTKAAVVEKIYGKKATYYIQPSNDVYRGTEKYNGNGFRISCELKPYSAIDRDYLYDVIAYRHALGTLVWKGEKWYEESLPPAELPEPMKPPRPPIHSEPKRSPPPMVQKHGYTLIGYNFCGPGNTLGYLPTSMVDALCQFHDMEYAYRPSSLEKIDDRQFRHMLNQWQTASIGDGWTGPTPFERHVVITMIQAAFEAKAKSDEPWAAMLIPSNVLRYMTKFKDYSENYKENWPDWKKLEWAKENPHTAAETMYEQLASKANYQRGEQRRELEPADSATVVVKNDWNAAAVKPPEAMPEYIKKWIKSQQHKYDTDYDGEPKEGMVIFQFIPSGPGDGSFIMNYIGKDKIFPIYFVQDQQRVPNFVYPFSKALSDIHPIEKISCGQWWNKRSIELNKDHPIQLAKFEPIFKVWSTRGDLSLQHIDPNIENEFTHLYSFICTIFIIYF